MECWSTPLQWLCEVAGYRQELEHAVIYADPEHPKHAQWVTCPVSMLAMQELGCFQLPESVYRLSITYACPYHNPTATMHRRPYRWASLRQFLTVCAEILWLCKPIVAAAVWVAGLRRSWRWRCWIRRSWAGVVTRGLRLWGWLDVLPNSLKRLWDGLW